MALVYRRVDRVLSGGAGCGSGAGDAGRSRGAGCGPGDPAHAFGDAGCGSGGAGFRSTVPGCEVREGDCLLIETAGTPGAGDLALVRSGGVESLCRWDGERPGELLGIVVGIRRML